jgi:hypothetical protein
MTEDADACTCRNRTLRETEVVMWIRPNKTGWITAKDCPLHGMRDLTPKEPVTSPDVSTLDSVASSNYDSGQEQLRSSSHVEPGEEDRSGGAAQAGA